MWNGQQPSWLSLLYVEAAVRHESFTLAAQELHVTQSAVSHQIRQLERDLGYPLFVRGPRGSIPTPRAVRLAHVMRASIQEIGGCLRDTFPTIRAATQTRTVELGIAPSLANQWLVPRLADFQQAHPGWMLRPRVGLAFHDLSTLDATLRYGLGSYQDASLPLPAERLAAVCSPALSSQASQAPVLQAYSPTSPRPDSPAGLWSKMYGETFAGPVVTFDRQSMAVIAAAEGQGVAIVPWQMARDMVTRGALVRADPRDVPDPLSYYLVWEPGHADPHVVESLRDWLSAQMSECIEHET